MTHDLESSLNDIWGRIRHDNRIDMMKKLQMVFAKRYCTTRLDEVLKNLDSMDQNDAIVNDNVKWRKAIIDAADEIHASKIPLTWIGLTKTSSASYETLTNIDQYQVCLHMRIPVYT